MAELPQDDLPKGIPTLIREVVVDPMWGGATCQIGGATVPVLALEHPTMGWAHYVFSPESLAKLARWASGEYAAGGAADG
jgi:hypothetical protein